MALYSTFYRGHKKSNTQDASRIRLQFEMYSQAEMSNHILKTFQLLSNQKFEKLLVQIQTPVIT